MRIANRLIAVLLALTLIAGGLIVAVQVILAVAGRPSSLVPWKHWLRYLRAKSWEAGWVRTILIGIAVLGALLLVLQIKRRRPALIPLAAGAAGVEAGTTRRSLVQALRAAAADVDGVSTASAKVTRRRAKVTAVSRLEEPVGLEQAVRDRVTAELASLNLSRSLRVRIRLRTKEGV